MAEMLLLVKVSCQYLMVSGRPVKLAKLVYR